MHVVVRRSGRLAAALALALAALPATAVLSPAQAQTYCQHFAGPTPSAEIDLDNDGNPEIRVPSLRDVSVCAQADVFTETRPLQLEQCEERNPRCWRVLVHVQASATADTGFTLCRTIDGSPSCSYFDQIPWTVSTPDVDTLCIGIDLDGGRPCAGGTSVIGFE